MKIPFKGENITVSLVSIAFILIAVVGMVILIRKWVKGNADNKVDIVEAGDPSTVLTSSPQDKEHITIFDMKTRKLKPSAQSMLSNLVKELTAKYHTDDDVILSSLSLLKTQGDLALMRGLYTNLYRKSSDLLIDMANEMGKDKYAEAIKFLNKLPKKIK